ncbi:sperm-associated antigen 17-like [Anneissia japonica]|uniref:sperm-associated antigen 17-like n=1 Tax=Anneissia japonica TaxID=1529436 RepID=UPI00142571AC|nr:sperm-associated antigen 17-like [Anneissia japonica]
MYSEICEAAKPHLDLGEDIPLQLLSKILKWKLLAIKQKDQKRREDEKKGNSDKDKKGGKEKGARSKSPVKGKGKKSPEVPSPKKESKLKKRGEDDDENKYIDDEPDDGPQHYIIIEGFTDAPLLPLLSDLQVNVDSIIKMNSENYENYEKMKKQLQDEEDDDPKLPEILEAEEIEREKKSVALKKFWDQHEKMLRRSPKESKLHDVARLTYTVQEKIIPTDLNDNEQKMGFGTVLFEDIACMMYDLLDLKRQYLNYRANMKLLTIPCPNAPAAPSVPDMQSSVSLPPTSLQQMQGEPLLEQKEKLSEVDMRYYNEMMNSLPHESVSVPLMLHCMLEQVVASEEGKVPPSETALQPRDDGLNHSLARHVNEVALKLTIHNDTRKHIEEEMKIQKKETGNGVKQPYLINFHDKMAYRLHHLKEINGFNPIESEKNMLNSTSCARLGKFPRPAAGIVKERAARLQELMYFCASGELTAIEIDRAFKQFVFESLQLRDTEEDGKVRDATKEDIVWDDPYALYQQPQENSLVEEQVTTEQAPRSRPGTGILRPDQPLRSKSRQGSAGSVKSIRSTAMSFQSPQLRVHFEKDADGQPIIPEKEILKTPEVTLSTRTSSTNLNLEDEIVQAVDVGIGVRDLAECQLRNLDEWSYAEYLEPHVLLQVLQEANQVHPYIDTYFHKRDHSLMVVMHNPIGQELMNYDTWNTQLHSDVGFRNYLEHIASSIEDWTQAEEKKHQAIMHEKEMEAMRKAAESPALTSSRAASSKSRTRSQSPKKSRSKSPRGRKSVSPTQSVDHLDPDGGNFMRPNSMKAWKIENDKLKEEERKQKEKGAKKSRSRSRSASPKKTEDKEKVKDKKREGSSRGKGKKDEKENVGEEPPAETPEGMTEGITETIYPFIGYDVGNNLIHVSGQTKTLFPSDGGQIRAETTNFIQGSSFVKTTVLKDGHVFGIHLLDPKAMKVEDESLKENELNFNEKAESEQPEKTDAEKETEMNLEEKKALSKFGAFTAHLNDGMILSYSCFGNSGKPKGSEEEEEVEIFIPPPPSPSPPPQSPSPKGRAGSGKKGKKQQQQQQQQEQEKLAQQQLIEQQQKEEEERKSKAMEEQAKTPDLKLPEFQQLHISCPDGLSVNYCLESEVTPETIDVPVRLLVKQAYPVKTAQKQDCEAARKIPAMMEESRIVTSNGAVIKFMIDGTTQVLFPDGTVSGGTGPGPVAPAKPPTSPPTSREASPSRFSSALSSDLQHKKSSVKATAAKGMSQITEELQEEPQKPTEWITTAPSGDRLGTKGDGSVFEVPPLMLYSATDPMTKEVMTTREDRVVTVDRPDGTRIVDHSEGTRITTFYTKIEARDEMSSDQAETGEVQHPVIHDVQHVKVECVGFATVIMNCEDSIATTVFPNGTQVITMPDGSYEVLHHEGSRMTIDSDGMCAYLPKPDNLNIVENLTTPSVYMMRHSDEKILELRDGNGNFFTVMNTGEVDVFVRPRPAKEDAGGNAEAEEFIDEKEGQEKSNKILIEEMEQFNEHPPRFFIIKSDGSGMELLRHRNVMDYLSNAECDPTSAILGDPLPDHPGMTGITIMRPYTENICKTWLMQLDEPNIIPRNLRSRDFKTLPAWEGKTPGPKFGTNVGKGVAIGSVHRPPKTIPPPKCPKALEVRQLIQYASITADIRAQMKDGLRAYAEHIKEKQEAWKAQEIYDPRDAKEKVQAGDLLAQILAEVDDEGENKDKNQLQTPTMTSEALPQSCTSESASQPKVEAATKPTSMIQLPADQGFGSGLRDLKSESDIVGVYEKVTAPPSPPPQPRSTARYSNEDWQKIRTELEEEKNCLNALKNREVPPYFSWDLGKSFLASNHPDMTALSNDLAKPKKPTKPSVILPADSLPNTPTDSPGETQQVSINVSDGVSAATSLKAAATAQTDSSPSPSTQVTNVVVSSPSDVRPTNPTPGHATGQGTPTPLRPTNPTPAHASQTQGLVRPGNPTPAGNQDMTSDTPSSHTSIPLHASTIPEHNEEGLDVDINQPTVTQETTKLSDNYQHEIVEDFPSARENLIFTRSLVVDVNGEPRKDKVNLPSSILGQKPGALPNQKFQEVEDPVRNKTFNSSIAGAKMKGFSDLNKIRGFELYPGQVNFGVVREGCTYTFNVLLKNIGVDSCRFKVKQPPPSTGLNVIYKSGPVAAGMNVTLQLELYAIAVGVKGGSGQGSIGHHVEISTEVDTLFLPVTADILTAHVYDEQCRIHGNISVSPGVRLVSARPPSRDGVIRPRKDRSQESTEFDSQLVQ